MKIINKIFFVFKLNLQISYIGWIEERMNNGYFKDPKQKYEQRFIIFKGSDICIFESPPVSLTSYC